MFAIDEASHANPNHNYSSHTTRQGKELQHNISVGIILSDQSLVLQSVSRASAGAYTCLAVNSEGKGLSNPVTLRIRCK